MHKVKYQIFVSSTYNDLKEERDQVIKACLEIGHIPVGMEMFSAADIEQWRIITRHIDDSDYFMVVVGNRYGSMVNGISYTEMEYDYAISKGIPILGFVIDPKEAATWPVDRSDIDKKARQKLQSFKKKVQTKPVNYWRNKDELHGQCAIALTKTIYDQPRLGWIRSSDVSSNQINQNYEIITNVYKGSENESGSLLSENVRLRLEIFKLKNDPLLITQPILGESVSRIIFVEGYVKDNNSIIWPIVRSVSGSTYWVQSLADIESDGRWRSKVVIGSDGTADVGARYQLVIFMNPKIALKEGDELKGWPDADYKSEPIEIVRK